MESEFDAGRTERAAAVELGQITVAAAAGGAGGLSPASSCYYVEIREGTFFSCTCPDFTMRLKEAVPCKHILALVNQVGERLVRWPAVLEAMGGK